VVVVCVAVVGRATVVVSCVVVVAVVGAGVSTVVQEVKAAISAAGIRRISVFIVESLC
jgi:hypothetical protein